VDAGFVDHKAKRVVAVDMSCPWLDNRARKDTEKTEKYKPLRWELTRQYPGYKIVQLNVIMDVLGGWSKEPDVELNKTFGARSSDILKRMQLPEHWANIQSYYQVTPQTLMSRVILQIEDSISFTLALVFHFYYRNFRLALV